MDKTKRAHELADHLWDIARQRQMMFTRATECSPTIADVTKDAANLLIELSEALAAVDTHLKT